MEDVLDVCARPYNPRFPVICMDEAPEQLVGEIRDPFPMRPGDPLRIDSECVRLGKCNLFMFCEPLGGWRQVRVTDRRTKVDGAYALRDFLNEFYRDAEKIVLVMDNLNTHSPGSFYEAFAPEEARDLTERLEIHYTPKHGSWLSIAEREFSVSVWIVGSTTRDYLVAKSMLGSLHVIRLTVRSIGNSRRSTHEPSCVVCILNTYGAIGLFRRRCQQ